MPTPEVATASLVVQNSRVIALLARVCHTKNTIASIMTRLRKSKISYFFSSGIEEDEREVGVMEVV